MSTDYDISKVDTTDLNTFTNTIAGHLALGIIPLRMALGPLHEVGLELNRRHGAASEQTHDDARNALDILNDVDQVDACYDENTNWAAVRRAEARAYGVLLDKGTDDIWAALAAQDGPDREAVWGQLFGLAVSEGRRLGFTPKADPEFFIPVDADQLVAPF